jgi:predicted  nucleic acid-binding Zn-ribbon protein
MNGYGFAGRVTRTSREVLAGCFTCNGSDFLWHGPQAQGTAARHHDATGHETWADVHLSVRYGGPE